jgi:hypothetical protein
MLSAAANSAEGQLAQRGQEQRGKSSGDADGRKRAAARRLALGGCSITELPCGHDTMLDMPEETASLLLAAAGRRAER